MNKFLLTMVSILLIGLQSNTAQAKIGALEGLRMTHTRLMAKQQAQELATMELDRVSAMALHKISIVLDGTALSSEHLGRALPPLTQVRAMLLEREALMGVLRNSYYETREALRKIVKAARNGAIVVKSGDGREQTPLNDSTLDNAADFYTENINTLLNEPVIFITGSRDPLNIIATGRELEKHGTHTESLLRRIEGRKNTGRRGLARALKELSKAIPSSTVLVRTLAKNEGFSVQIEASATPLVKNWKEMGLPGVETKAMIYELAARIAATQSEAETVLANLQRILALNNDNDSVQMTVALRGREVVLQEESLLQVQQLYLQIFDPLATRSSD